MHFQPEITQKQCKNKMNIRSWIKKTNNTLKKNINSSKEIHPLLTLHYVKVKSKKIIISISVNDTTTKLKSKENRNKLNKSETNIK